MSKNINEELKKFMEWCSKIESDCEAAKPFMDKYLQVTDESDKSDESVLKEAIINDLCIYVIRGSHGWWMTGHPDHEKSNEDVLCFMPKAQTNLPNSERLEPEHLAKVSEFIYGKTVFQKYE